jgi:hypothetical protein
VSDINLADFDGMTPGPWTLRVGLDKASVMAGDVYVADVPLHSWGGVSRTEGEANARAIAALPDAFAELRRLREEVAEQRAEIDQREILEAESVGERDKLRARIAELERDRETLAEFAKTAPGRLPERVTLAIERAALEGQG